MQAIVYRQFGTPEVLRCEEAEKPAPRKGEVLIRVHAAGLNPLDWKLMMGRPWVLRLALGLHQAKRPGVDVAGTVEAVGSGETRFKPGDAVFGACKGALAEYACAPAFALAIKPENVSFEEAASVPIAAWTALQGLRDKGWVKPGQKVLINGAAGGVGSFAVQIAKHLGAEVTGVCSTRNVEAVRALGADRVLDYTRQEVAEDGERYDVVLECVGNLPVPVVRHLLKPRGRCVMVGAKPDVSLMTILGNVFKLLVVVPFLRQKIVVVMAKRRPEDLRTITDLMQSGSIRPVIERCYEMGEVAEAMRYLAAGHVGGKLVVRIA
ncbi:MAG TPA: NAD(P)-dependent alcohol dehydrogenase [Acidobacteriaceae bacterium]|nr:NAD(P)-dependent alcohol dehydrogenase [Acidobacteriaceae bacterium]